MNKLLPSAITSILFALLAVALPVTHAYATPSLLYDKTTVSVAQNTTFTVTININVDANTAQSSKATVTYAPNDLEVVQTADGHFFPSFAQANDAANGVLEITGYTTSAGSGSTANGQLATITFKAKKGSGSSLVSFSCTNSGHDSNILTVSGQNILTNCAQQTNQIAVSYTGESTPTNTPTPTPLPGTTLTPTPTPTPGAGGSNTIPTCVMLSSDTSLAVGIPLAVTFTCSGVDPDGYINAAEFTFGDRSSDTIYKNAGSPGSISTTHTYTTIGTLGATCRVRDNNNVFSNATNDCKRIISINPKPTNTVAKTYYQRVIAADKGSVVPVVTPTPVQVAIVFTTPTPIIPEVSPTLSLQPAKNPLDNLIWWIVGSFIAILGAVLLFRRKNPPPPPFTQPPPIAQ